MNGDEDLGQDIKMKGEPFHFEQSAGQLKKLDDDLDPNGRAEKFSVTARPIAKTHTTFAG